MELGTEIGDESICPIHGKLIEGFSKDDAYFFCPDCKHFQQSEDDIVRPQSVENKMDNKIRKNALRILKSLKINIDKHRNKLANSETILEGYREVMDHPDESFNTIRQELGSIIDAISELSFSEKLECMRCAKQTAKESLDISSKVRIELSELEKYYKEVETVNKILRQQLLRAEHLKKILDHLKCLPDDRPSENSVQSILMFVLDQRTRYTPCFKEPPRVPNDPRFTDSIFKSEVLLSRPTEIGLSARVLELEKDVSDLKSRAEESQRAMQALQSTTCELKTVLSKQSETIALLSQMLEQRQEPQPSEEQNSQPQQSEEINPPPAEQNPPPPAPPVAPEEK